MGKKIITILILFQMLFLSSCFGGRMIIFDDGDRMAEARMEQVMEAIKNVDREALKEMFSERALSEVDDFDDNLDALFDYVQGIIQSWESTGAYSGSEKVNFDGVGSRIKSTESTYVFTTDEQEYRIAIYEFTEDTSDPNNVGIYSICIISSKDYDYPEFVFWGSGDVGIHIG